MEIVIGDGDGDWGNRMWGRRWIRWEVKINVITVMWQTHHHGGTTEEGNCSYLLPFPYCNHGVSNDLQINCICSAACSGNSKENFQAPHYWLCMRETTSDRWIPLTKVHKQMISTLFILDATCGHRHVFGVFCWRRPVPLPNAPVSYPRVMLTWVNDCH